MRSLTPAESQVVAALLGSDQRSQRSQIATTGLPSRTFEAAARRLFSEGWLYDRYLPNPSRFGFPIVTFSLVHPYADRREAVTAESQALPGVVLQWDTPDWVFSVSLTATSRPRRGPGLASVNPANVSRSFVMTADSRAANLPVYFDFEGAWATLAGVARSAGYPRSLPGVESTVAPDVPDHRLASDRRSALALAERGPAQGVPGGARRPRSPLFFSRRERRALERGVSEHRVFLDFTRIPSTRAQRISGVVLVHGRLKVRRPELLFVDLVERCGVAPFLFVTNAHGVLIGLLTAADASGRSRTSPAEPVLPTLGEYLEGVEVDRSPSEGFRTGIDHDYRRVFASREVPTSQRVPEVVTAPARADPPSSSLHRVL